MSLPSPVPSKAAIHALRGLAFGTTCVLGVIIEDRRRRICALKKVVANKEKLQSSRLYHSAGRDRVATIIEESAIYPADGLRLRERDDTSLRSIPRNETAHNHNQDRTDTFSSDLRQLNEAPSPSPPPPPHPPPLPYPVSTRPLNSQRSVSIFNKVESQVWAEIESTPFGRVRGSPKKTPAASATPVTVIEDILAGSDPSRLARAASSFVNHTRPDSIILFGDKWYELSLRIAIECRATGDWEHASRVLVATIGLGPLDEFLYYEYDPMSLIRANLAINGAKASADGLGLATKMFLARFTEKATLDHRLLEDNARELIDQLLMAKKHVLAQNVYWRTLSLTGQKERFVGWAISRFHKHEDHKNVIKHFVLAYSKINPSHPKYVGTTIDHVLDSLGAMKGLKSDQVIDALARMKSPPCGIRTRYLMTLLHHTWLHHQDYSKVEAVFQKFIDVGLMDRVVHPEGVLACMISQAVAAKDDNMVRKYYDLALSQGPHVRENVHVNVAVARWKATVGDWDAVRQQFRLMAACPKSPPTNAVVDRNFVPILQLYSAGRTWTEIEAFVLEFMRDMGVSLTSNLVSQLVLGCARERDVKRLIAWIERGVKAGVPLDHNFTELVVGAMRKYCDMSHSEMQSFISKIEALSPGTVEPRTHRMLELFLSQKDDRRKITGKTIGHGQSTNNYQIYAQLAHEMALGRHTAARKIYQQAMDFGMRFCPYCFMQLIRATALDPGQGYGVALSLLRKEHAAGNNVQHGVTQAIWFRLYNITGSAEEQHTQIRNMVAELEQVPVPIGPRATAHICHAYLRIGYWDKSVALLRSILQNHPDWKLSDDEVTFTAASAAYALTSDVENLSRLCSRFLEVRSTRPRGRTVHWFNSLLRRVKKVCRHTEATAACVRILENTRSVVRKDRALDREMGRTISREAVRIVEGTLENPFTRQSDSEVNSEEELRDLADDMVDWDINSASSLQPFPAALQATGQ